MTDNKTNSEALDNLFDIDGQIWGNLSLVRMARIRASILHASSAWGSDDDGALIGALADEVERLREAGTELAGFAVHDGDCEDVTGAYPGSCSCGYSRAWKAWNDATGETE
jgi:hypothetical protein